MSLDSFNAWMAANPEWQQRCRDESAHIGDAPLDIDTLDKG